MGDVGREFIKGFNSFFEEVELTKEECLAEGMSDKEYGIQKALGSLPTRSAPVFRETHGSYTKLIDGDVFDDNE